MSLVASDKLISRPWGWEGICPQACLVQNQPLQSILKYISGGTDNNHISTQNGQWSYGAMEPLGWFRCLLWPEWTASVQLIHNCLFFFSRGDVWEYKTLRGIRSAKMGMTGTSMEGFISCRWQIWCYMANQYKTMLWGYWQQPGTAAVHVSDNRSSEISVSRNIHTCLVTVSHPQEVEDVKICYSALGVWEFWFSSTHAAL